MWHGNHHLDDRHTTAAQRIGGHLIALRTFVQAIGEDSEGLGLPKKAGIARAFVQAQPPTVPVQDSPAEDMARRAPVFRARSRSVEHRGHYPALLGKFAQHPLEDMSGHVGPQGGPYPFALRKTGLKMAPSLASRSTSPSVSMFMWSHGPDTGTPLNETSRRSPRSLRERRRCLLRREQQDAPTVVMHRCPRSASGQQGCKEVNAPTRSIERCHHQSFRFQPSRSRMKESPTAGNRFDLHQGLPTTMWHEAPLSGLEVRCRR